VNLFDKVLRLINIENLGSMLYTKSM